MSATDLHDNSAAAVAARRRHWASQRASAPTSGAGATRRSSGGLHRHAARYARNPVRYSRENGVGGAVLTFFALIAIATLRRGALPAQGEWLTIAGGTLIVVIAASVAPELVTALLLTALVVMVLTNAQLFLKLIDWATGRAVAVAS